MERNRGVLPAHVVHKEQHEIGPFPLLSNVRSNDIGNRQVSICVGVHPIAPREQLGVILKDGVEFQQGDVLIRVLRRQLANPRAQLLQTNLALGQVSKAFFR